MAPALYTSSEAGNATVAGPRTPSRIRSEWVASSTATASAPKPASTRKGSSSRRGAGIRASQAAGKPVRAAHQTPTSPSRV